MGSLMAGWSSQVLADDHKVRLMRNRSLTKEEVDAFWRQHRKPAEVDGGETVTSPPASSPRVERPLRRFERMRSLPPRTPSHGQTSPASFSEPSSPATRVDGDGDAAGSSPSTSRDWWTRSSWAFLNEPPREASDRFNVDRIVTGNA